MVEPACPACPKDDSTQHGAKLSSSTQIRRASLSDVSSGRSNSQITSIGLMLVLSNLATLLVLDPSFSGRELPSWAYFSSVDLHLLDPRTSSFIPSTQEEDALQRLTIR